MTEEELTKMLAAHREEFGEFTEDWKNHRQETKATSAKIDAINHSLSVMAPNMAHLAQLPLIAGALASIDRSNNAQLNTLITQAGAAGKSGTRIVERVIYICAILVVAMGICLTLLFLRDSRHSVKLNHNGLDISIPSDSSEKKTKED